MSCSLCGEAADSLGIWHRGCGCFTHTDCFHDRGITPNYKTCPQHLGQVSAPAVKEPVPKDGVDYVLFPGRTEEEEGRRGIVSGITSLVLRRAPAASGGGIALLRQRVPIADIMSRHKMGLQHLLKEGVHIVDFLDNGYTWDDIKCYEDLRKGRERACKALTALGVCATHLKEAPDALPAARLRADMGLVSADFCTVLGLAFPDMGSLRCNDDDEWNAKHCVALGLTGQDLCDFGLAYLQQYEDLMYGLSKADAAAAERELGMTRDIIAGLEDWDEPQPRQEEHCPEPLEQRYTYSGQPRPHERVERVERAERAERAERPREKMRRPREKTRRPDRFDRHGLVLEVFGGSK